MSEVLYRVEEGIHYGYYITKYPVLRDTPKGKWVKDPNSTSLDTGGDERWVSNTSTKRLAYPTIREALNSFYHRKRRQVTILKAQLEKAQKYEKDALRILEENEGPITGKEMDSIVGDIFLV